jgi:hypothetical protein
LKDQHQGVYCDSNKEDEEDGSEDVEEEGEYAKVVGIKVENSKAENSKIEVLKGIKVDS